MESKDFLDRIKVWMLVFILLTGAWVAYLAYKTTVVMEMNDAAIEERINNTAALEMRTRKSAQTLEIIDEAP